MTERIDDFASQCEGKTICYCGQTGFNYEKFAELIVRECMGVVEDAVNHREPASTYVSKIREHFGIE